MTTERTWIDVTDLMAWTGNPTGIARVTSGLVSRYAARAGVGFFVFSESSRTFTEVDVSDLARSWPESRWRRDADAPSRPRTDPTLHRIARGLSGPVRRRLPTPAKAIIRRAARVIRDPLRWLTRLATSAPTASPNVGGRGVSRFGPRGLVDRIGPARSRAVSFGPTDTVLVLGAGWSSPSLQAALADQKHAIGIQIYQLLYDLTPILLPQCFGAGFTEKFTRYLFEAMSISDGLIAISERSRSDALRFCDDLLISPPPIEVFRLGDELPGSDGGPEAIEPLKDSEFVLSIGTFEARKNHLLLYQTWKLAAEAGRSLPRLVIVGRVGWAAGDTLLAIQNDPLVGESIQVLHDVSDRQLDWLYDECIFAIYPSLYEGWGLPIAEALARGKLCLASSAPAMPEVAGDLIDYFSPYSAAECLSLVERYLDPLVREAKANVIRNAYKPTSWDDASLDFDEALGRAQARHLS